jgi:hypothetical protein
LVWNGATELLFFRYFPLGSKSDLYNQLILKFETDPIGFLLEDRHKIF